ncbi:hypothetical protein [Glycocaulis sp.]
MKLFHTDALKSGFALLRDNPVPVALAAGICAAMAAAESLVLSLAADPGLLTITVLAVLGFYAWVIAAGLVGRASVGLDWKGLVSNNARDLHRLVLVALLGLVLLVTVLGTAFVMLAFMLGALAILGADRTGLTEPPEEFVNIFTLFNTTEWVIAVVLIALWSAFAFWFLSRLLPAIPATLHRGKVQLLATWPVLQGRGIGVLLTGLVAILPGIALMTGFCAGAEALAGYNPASGAGDAPAALKALLRAVLVGGSAGLVFAPLLGLHGVLFMKFTSQTA